VKLVRFRKTKVTCFLSYVKDRQKGFGDIKHVSKSGTVGRKKRMIE
jgi:hypothetical protein